MFIFSSDYCQFIAPEAMIEELQRVESLHLYTIEVGE